ncbi:MAG: hypothetical protein WD690_07950 [Vicinamibacterales bacterium]
MKSLAALAILLFTLAPGQTAGNLTGTWSGTFTMIAEDGTPREMKIELTLTHKGKDLTGSAGPSAEQQWPLSNGVVAGDKVTFQVQENSNGPLISFTLTHAKDRLTGQASGEDDGRKLSAKIDAGRVK